MTKLRQKRTVKKPDYSQQNSVVVGVFAGLMIGFIAALLLNAFQVGKNSEAAGWVQAVSSVVAALISAYAVYLVAQTLKATRDTLIATQWMAEQQTRIGNAQTRPYLLLEHTSSEDRGDRIDLKMVFRNYGSTPATSITIKSTLVTHEEYQVDENEWDSDVVGIKELKPNYSSVVAPASDYEASVIVQKAQLDFGPNRQPSVEVELRYNDHDDTQKYNADKHIYFSKSDSGLIYVSSVW